MFLLIVNRIVFGENHQKYADVLLDYGFFLVNVDASSHSIKHYENALRIIFLTFGNRNFHAANAHEEIAYAYYVNEYITGKYDCANCHVDDALNIMLELVPNNHLKLSSAKRIKALLLEEIALYNIAHGLDAGDLLKQSEKLHKGALRLSLEVFGEMNVQTAKLYGSLGRLYQSMQRYKVSVKYSLKINASN